MDCNAREMFQKSSKPEPEMGMVIYDTALWYADIQFVPVTDDYWVQGPSRSWSYGSWIYNYLCNQCLSPLRLWVRGILDATLCDKVCQWLVTGRWFSQVTPVSSTNKTDHHDITEILLKVVWNTTTLTLTNWVQDLGIKI
jgi:hypothetical protein